MHWSSALAVLGFATNAVSQGSAGGAQTSCASPGQDFVYSGCYNTGQNGRHAGFPWQLSSSSNDAKYYPGFTGQMTVSTCHKACRGHGFKWAALFYGSECYCSVAFPLPTNPQSITAGPGAPQGGAPNTTTTQINCNSVCNGDPFHTCGGGDAAAVYYDPSFPSDTSAIRGANNYGYVGCYNNVAPGPSYITLQTTSTQACQAYCGLIGYAFSHRSGIDSNTGTTCGCGSEIQSGLQIPESNCNFKCDGGSAA